MRSCEAGAECGSRGKGAANMLPCLRPLQRYRFPIALALPVLLLLPLPLALRSQKAYCGFTVLLMAVYWCSEVIPLAVTAILPVLLFPLFGIMTSKEVCMQYLKDTNMLFLGGLMVAVAIESWNFHKRIALRALLIVGVRPALLMMGFMGVTAFLSMWISNTATTTMMVPIAQAVLDQLSTTSVQSPNLEGGPSPDPPGVELEEKHASPVVHQPGGLDGTVQGHGRTCLSCQVAETQDPESRLKRGLVAGSSPQDEIEQQCRLRKMLSLSICYAASIGGTATLTGTGPNLVLKGQFGQIFPENGGVINFTSWFGFAFPNMVITLTCCWIWLHALFLGVNFRALWRCGAESSVRESAAYSVIRVEYRKLGPMTLAEKLVLGLFVLLVLLLFTRDPGFAPGWATIFFNRKGKEFVTDATVVIFIALLLFVTPVQRSQPPPWARGSCAPEEGEAASELGESSTGRLLEWPLVQRKLPWNVILLLGGGFALARGCEESGLSQWLGTQLLPLQNMPPWSIAVILCLLIVTFTECTSNVATATIFLPILASMTTLMRLNPLYVMIPATLSTSLAFMLPVATPPNAIVFSYGHLQVSDMVKAGLVLNLIGVASITLAINTWGKAMFQLDTFPTWANISNSL